MTTALSSPSKTVDVFALPVLAAADVFPMMPDDELQELAADIKENGLHEPLVIADVQIEDGEIAEVLVDGRNRRAACKLAGVEPTVRRLNGEDPNAYVISANIHRRHMKQAQRAMAVAMIYPEPSKNRKAGYPLEIKGYGVNQGSLSQARFVLRLSRPLAESVLAGIKPLDVAYKDVQAAEQTKMGDSARMERLQAEAPDLADLVPERMSLSEALAANNQRQSERAHRIKEARDAGERLWRDISNSLGCIAHGQELGEQYILPDEDRDFAEQLIRRLAALLGKDIE